MPFESDEATGLNKDIFETIYFAAMTASKDLAKKDGAYETFPGSPLSQGKFQFDLWDVTPDSGRWDWESLRAEVVEHGVRNSLLVAPMPTASTAQILGNNESFEPYTSNIYVRRVLSGEFMVVNKHLLKDLVKLGLWNDADEAGNHRRQRLGAEHRPHSAAHQGPVQDGVGDFAAPHHRLCRPTAAPTSARARA